MSLNENIFSIFSLRLKCLCVNQVNLQSKLEKYQNNQESQWIQVSTISRKDVVYVSYQNWHCICNQYGEVCNTSVPQRRFILKLFTKYLKRLPNKGLFFKKNKNKSIKAFIDANWTGSIGEIIFTIRYCIFVFENLLF